MGYSNIAYGETDNFQDPQVCSCFLALLQYLTIPSTPQIASHIPLDMDELFTL